MSDCAVLLIPKLIKDGMARFEKDSLNPKRLKALSLHDIQLLTGPCFDRIRELEDANAELQSRVEPLQPFKERITTLQAALDEVKGLPGAWREDERCIETDEYGVLHCPRARDIEDAIDELQAILEKHGVKDAN